MRDTERDLRRQIEAVNQKFALKESEVVRANGKIETLQAYTATMEKEVKEWRQKVESLNNEIHNG